MPGLARVRQARSSTSTFGGSWYRVQIGFGTGSVHDVTTWDATIIGDPVRLIK